MNDESSTQTPSETVTAVDAREIFNALPIEWMPLLPDFGVRLLDLDELMQPGDFQLSAIQGEPRRALYARGDEFGQPAHTLSGGVFRYTARDFVARDRGFTFPVFPEQIATQVQAWAEARAAAERERLGKAVARYREEMEIGTAGEALRPFALACDEALAAFKFEMRGGWWDARTGTWGIGALEDEDRDFADAGGVISGPHS